MKDHVTNQYAFTLIELLIVVAIIGILAAIAVPNFLNAQTRAKVARVRADLRAISMSLEAYRIDHNAFPFPRYNGLVFGTFNHIATVLELTTPISYMSTVDMEDPFVPRRFWNKQAQAVHPTYVYVSYKGDWGMKDGIISFGVNDPSQLPEGYGLTSQGPDYRDSGGVWFPGDIKVNRICPGCMYDRMYNASNGLHSPGDILRFGGGVSTPVTQGGG